MARKKDAEKPETQRAQGIEDCAWNADGERCHYPGTIWRSTNGTGPGFCRFHIQEDITAAYGAQVVVQSRNYKPRTMAERDHDAVFGKRTGERACQERTCPITTRALPGKDFCAKHQAQFERDPDSVRRVGLQKRVQGFRNAGELEPPRSREPGDDDEEIAA